MYQAQKYLKKNSASSFSNILEGYLNCSILAKNNIGEHISASSTSQELVNPPEPKWLSKYLSGIWEINLDIQVKYGNPYMS